MSRGLGISQRRIMAAVEGKPDGEWTGLYDLAPDGERAEIESLRRAVKTLQARGLIETGKIRLISPRANKDRLRPSRRHAHANWGMYPGKWNPQTLAFRLPASPERKLKEAEYQLRQLGLCLMAGRVADQAAVQERVRELSDETAALKREIEVG